MAEIRRAEHHKKPGVCYAVTDDGLELPVVDVTHPAFEAALSEERQQALASHFLDEQRRFAKLPSWLRRVLLRFFMRGSRIGRGLRRADGGFLDSMTTYLFKLGPKNLGSYAVPVDHRILMSLPAISVRMRLTDMARLLADGLAPRLVADARRPLHFINIAGGPAVDSLNTLLVLRREQPDSIAERRIVVQVLDGDQHGPAFGARALAALQAPGAPPRRARHHVRAQLVTIGATSPGSRPRSTLPSATARSSSFHPKAGCSSTARTKTFWPTCARSGKAWKTACSWSARSRATTEIIRTLKLTSTAATKPRGLPVFTALIADAGWQVTRSNHAPAQRPSSAGTTK